MALQKRYVVPSIKGPRSHYRLRLPYFVPLQRHTSFPAQLPGLTSDTMAMSDAVSSFIGLFRTAGSGGATWGTPVVQNFVTVTSYALVMSGVTSGQPIALIHTSRGGTTLSSITDTFSTPYTWTQVEVASSNLELWIGTGGAGTSGTITVNTPNDHVAGLAVPLTGASTASGLSAVDVSTEQPNTAQVANQMPSVTLTPSASYEAAIYADTSNFWSIVTSPPSPWAVTNLTDGGSTLVGVALYNSPTSGVPLSTLWTVGGSGGYDAVGAIIIGVVPDSISLSDSNSLAVKTSLTTADTQLTSDAVTRKVVEARTTADTAATSDSTSAGIVDHRTSSETMLMSDVATRAAMSFIRTASDTALTSDTAGERTVISRTSSDTVTTSDAVTRLVVLNRTSSDTALTSDAATRAFVISRTGADTVLTVDSTSGSLVENRTSTETMLLSDAAVQNIIFSRTSNDTSLLSDSAFAGITISRTSTDTVLTSDSVIRLIIITSTGSDTVTLSDGTVVNITSARSSTDTATTSDAVTRLIVLSRSTSDTALTSDVAVTGTFVITRSAVDTNTLSDVTVRFVILSRSSADTVLTSDVATGVSTTPSATQPITMVI